MATCSCREYEGDDGSCEVHYPKKDNHILILALIIPVVICWLGGIILACGGVQ